MNNIFYTKPECQYIIIMGMCIEPKAYTRITIDSDEGNYQDDIISFIENNCISETEYRKIKIDKLLNEQ